MNPDTTDSSSERASTAQQLDPEKDGRTSPPADGPKPPPPGSDAPDGGSRAWLVVLGAWTTSFVTFGWVNSMGVFQEYYQNELLTTYSPGTISWIPSLQIFFMLGLGPFVGQIYDHYGPRWLIFGGTFLHVFGLMMTSISTKYYQILLSQGICSAIGVAAVVSPGMSVVHGWFSTNRGLAFGVLTTGSSLGGVIFPIMVNRLIKEVGFPWTMRICAFMILGLLIIANLTVRAFHPPQPRKLNMAQLVGPLKELEFLFLVIGFFLFTYGVFVPINYLEVQALAVGMRPGLAEYLISMLNAASFFGRLSAGFIGDKVGRYNIFVVVGYLTPIWILALWIPSDSDGAIIAFAVLFGFCSGAYVSLISPLVAQISPIQEIGFRTGIVFLADAIAGLTTNPINGAILGDGNNWTGVKIFSGCFCLAGTTFIFAARIRRTGWKLMAAF
ncbi:major facilitator superfamily transporter [Colletotrichum somersetense]|nr:major facilitator superfamily transporter [Colletotrichum somersetense]